MKDEEMWPTCTLPYLSQLSPCPAEVRLLASHQHHESNPSRRDAEDALLARWRAMTTIVHLPQKTMYTHSRHLIEIIAVPKSAIEILGLRFFLADPVARHLERRLLLNDRSRLRGQLKAHLIAIPRRKMYCQLLAPTCSRPFRTEKISHSSQA